MALERQINGLKGFAKMVGGPLQDLVLGKVFVKDFLIRQWSILVVVVAVLFIHIALRFSCEDQVKQIDRLKEQLDDVKMEALSRSSDLLGMGKQSQIKWMVAERDSSLIPSVTPPYIITK